MGFAAPRLGTRSTFVSRYDCQVRPPLRLNRKPYGLQLGLGFHRLSYRSGFSGAGVLHDRQQRGRDNRIKLVAEATKFPLRWSHSTATLIVIAIRLVTGFPFARRHLRGYPNNSRSIKWSSILAFLLALLGIWPICVGVLLSATVLAYVFGEMIAVTVVSLLAPGIIFMPKKHTARILSLFFSLEGILYFLAVLFGLASSALLVFLFFIVGQVLVTISLLTFAGFYLNSSLGLFTVTSWLASVFIQLRNVFRIYKAPVFTVYKEYIRIVRKAVLRAEENGLMAMPTKPFENKDACLRLRPKREQPPGRKWINWKIFLDNADPVFDEALYQVLKDDCPDSPVATVLSEHNPLDVSDRKRDYDPMIWIMRLLNVWRSPKTVESGEHEQLLRDRIKRRELVQHFLRVRLLNEFVKFAGFVILLSMILFFVFAFNGLWDTVDKNSDSLLFTIALVPIFTFYQQNIGATTLDKHQRLLVKRIAIEGIKRALEKATKEVSDHQLFVSGPWWILLEWDIRQSFVGV